MYDDSVQVADIRRCDFEVVDRGDNVELYFAICGRLEYASIDLNAASSRAVEGMQKGAYACLFAGAGRPIQQEMRKVLRLSLCVNVRYSSLRQASL